jgi:hypothetical protein
MQRSIRLAALGLVLAASTAVAQDSKLQVHGYLTQAYGKADTGAYLGVPKDGTTDYRIAALQVRYAMTGSDEFVLQLSHRRLGTSPMTVGEPDVAMDWVYYNRRFGDLSARIGRVPIPAGIYNEIRDVGVLLPLYRAPYNFYFEGAFTSETVDGAVLRYDVAPASPWNAEVSAYGGTWKMTQRVDVGGAYEPLDVRVKNAFGGEAWVNTPFQDVRVGGGASRFDAGDAYVGGVWKEWHASLDGSTQWATLRGEYRKITTDDIRWIGYYAYLGLHPYKGLTLHGQLDFGDLLYKDVPAGVPPMSLDWDRTKTVGVSYAFRPDVVAKGEYHFTKGYWADDPYLDPFSGDAPAKVNYFLLSLSVSF